MLNSQAKLSRMLLNGDCSQQRVQLDPGRHVNSSIGTLEPERWANHKIKTSAKTEKVYTEK